jgi:hypothetical protein
VNGALNAHEILIILDDESQQRGFTWYADQNDAGLLTGRILCGVALHCLTVGEYYADAIPVQFRAI